jgi:uncharacterized protein YbjT (DUF2867 family)
VGSRVVELLTRRGVSVRAGTRTPGAWLHSDALVEPVTFDFDRPETFEPALQGADPAFLMARTGDAVSPDVERVLGRPPITFSAFARDSANMWTVEAR